MTCELWSFPPWLVGTCDFFFFLMWYFWSHVSTGSFNILGQLFLCPQVVFLICILLRSLVFLLCAFSPLWYSFQWTQPALASPEFQLYLLNSRRLMNFTWIYPSWVATWKFSPGNRLGAVGCWQWAHLICFLSFRDLYPTLPDIQCL